jgi:hypothetical protein
MPNRYVEFSPQRYARSGGTLYLAIIVLGAFADLISPAILIPPLIGETSFCLWLLVKGVNVGKWQECVSARTRSVD